MRSAFLTRAALTSTPGVIIEASADADLTLTRIIIAGTGALRLFLRESDAAFTLANALAWDEAVVARLDIGAPADSAGIVIPRGGSLGGACGESESLTVTVFGYAEGRS